MSDKRILELIELLAEYLQKTDRLMERMDHWIEKTDRLYVRAHEHDLLFEKQFARMDVAYQVIVAHSERIDVLQQQTKELQQQTKDLQLQTKDLQLQTKDLQQQTKDFQGKNDTVFDTLLKEILSISKRVQTIEGKS